MLGVMGMVLSILTQLSGSFIIKNGVEDHGNCLYNHVCVYFWTRASAQNNYCVALEHIYVTTLDLCSIQLRMPCCQQQKMSKFFRSLFNPVPYIFYFYLAFSPKFSHCLFYPHNKSTFLPSYFSVHVYTSLSSPEVFPRQFSIQSISVPRRVLTILKSFNSTMKKRWKMKTSIPV